MPDTLRTLILGDLTDKPEVLMTIEDRTLTGP